LTGHDVSARKVTPDEVLRQTTGGGASSADGYTHQPTYEAEYGKKAARLAKGVDIVLRHMTRF